MQILDYLKDYLLPKSCNYLLLHKDDVKLVIGPSMLMAQQSFHLHVILWQHGLELLGHQQFES